MSTLTSKDINLKRPSTKVMSVPGGASSISFGSDTLPPPPPVVTLERKTAVDIPVLIAPPVLPKLEITPTKKAVGLAIAAPPGSELFITTSLATALAALGITNVVVSHVGEPAILPFLVKNMAASCAVVLAVAALTTESAGVSASLTSALLQIGLDSGSCPVIPGVLAPSSLLELKAVMSNYATTWTNAVHSAIAIQQGALVANHVNTHVSEEILAAAVKVPVTSGTTALDHLIADFRTSLKQHGARGIVGINRSFRLADVDNSGYLDFAEFTTIIAQHTLHWTPEQVKSVFDSFDNNKDGKISHEEFVRAVRGELNARRIQMVLMAFQLLDTDESGVIEVSDLLGLFDGSKHPDVISGKRAFEDVLREFLDTFDAGEKDGKVTPEEFIEYYANVSGTIDCDDYFELMMRNAWHISGGEGWCANTTCRRVLVTHTDGHQSVQEIKNDFGMNANDVDAMIAKLKEQGVDAVSITIRGQEMKIAEEIPVVKPTAGMTSGVPIGQERSYVSIPLPNANAGGNNTAPIINAAGNFTKQEDGFAARACSRRVMGAQAQSTITFG